jgi:hypothetical protein
MFLTATTDVLFCHQPVVIWFAVLAVCSVVATRNLISGTIHKHKPVIRAYIVAYPRVRRCC